MRIVFYTRPAFFDTTLPLVRALSTRAEVHLVLEVAPESQRSGIVDLDLSTLHRGLQSADPVLHGMFPPGVRDYWRGVATFNVLVHDSRKTFHPATLRVGGEFLRFARHLQPDVVHIEGPTLRLLGASRGLSRTPVVMRIHDPEAHSGERSWRHSAAHYLTRGSVDRFVLFSERLVPMFIEKNRSAMGRTDVIPLGPLTFFRAWLDVDNSHAIDGDRRPSILFFGRLSPYKGLDVLYQALPAIAIRVPGLRVVVAGQPSGGYTPPPAPLLPNGGQIEVIEGYIGNAMLAALFGRAAVVVCPYRDATQSGVAMNAFGLGVPVIATRTGGMPEYIAEGKTGLLVDPGDAEQLAEAVAEFLTNDALRERLISGVALLIQGDGCWPVIADKMIATYVRAIETHRAGAKHRYDA